MTATPPAGGPAYQGLLIDYGGVLTTSIFESFHAFERREGLARATVARLFATDPEARATLDALEVGADSETRFEARLGALLGVPGEGLIERLLGSARVEPAVFDAVRAVHDAGLRTALVSNSWGTALYPVELLGELFDVRLLSGEVGLRKPDPAIYLRAVDELGLDPGVCVFVDDLQRNLEPAARLGMATVHHTDPELTVAELGRLFALDLTSQPR